MAWMDQRDLVYGGRSAGIVKFLKAVLQNPAWPRPLADRPRVLAEVAERPVLRQPAAGAGGQEEGQPAGQPSQHDTAHLDLLVPPTGCDGLRERAQARMLAVDDDVTQTP